MGARATAVTQLLFERGLRRVNENLKVKPTQISIHRAARARVPLSSNEVLLTPYTADIFLPILSGQPCVNSFRAPKFAPRYSITPSRDLGRHRKENHLSFRLLLESVPRKSTARCVRGGYWSCCLLDSSRAVARNAASYKKVDESLIEVFVRAFKIVQHEEYVLVGAYTLESEGL